MAGWFGHTQTVASISKSVSTVAGGIIGLETNLTTFMKKVIYYERFFQRVGPNLPEAMIASANRLFSRCYEYRDEIRDELESSLAYVADAGRWIVGLEDWNTKMEKRLHQINELVLLANTLLVEYAITGSYGAKASRDELNAYLRIFNASVVLQTDKNSAPNSSTSTSSTPISSSSSSSLLKTASDADEPCKTKSFVDNVVKIPIMNQAESPIESSTSETSIVPSEETTHDSSLIIGISPDDLELHDEDALNPFSRSSSDTVEKSEARKRSFDSAENQSQHQITSNDCASESEDSQASSLSDDYECLDKEAIPKFLAFKQSQSALPRRRQKSRTKWSLSSRNHFESNSPMKNNRHATKPLRTVNSKKISTTEAGATTATATATATETATETEATINGSSQRLFEMDEKHQQRLRQVMDLSASFDFQREFECNPFISPSSVEKYASKQFPTTIQEDDDSCMKDSSTNMKGSTKIEVLNKETEGKHKDQEPNEVVIPLDSSVEEQQSVFKSFKIGEDKMDENVVTIGGTSNDSNDDSASSINSLRERQQHTESADKTQVLEPLLTKPST